MDFGANLPLMDFGGNPYTLVHLIDYADRAERLGFKALAANDHLVFSVPWLDGPTALAAVMGRARRVELATTVALPVVRGPVPLAKSLAAIDRLSGGRLVAAVGPGSSEKDHATVALDFEERWKRLDEAVRVLRALWQRDGEPFEGRFYSTRGLELSPYPARDGGPPIWIGSWGSEAGLRRVARLADGWLASAYNTTPEMFADALERLKGHLEKRDREANDFPNAVATMWFHISDDTAETERVFRERLVPTINRPEEVLRERLPVGPPQAFAEKLAAYRDAGARRVFVWPVADEVRQIELFWERVVPLLDG